MEKNVQVLDCTLRDGGYVNDWNFGHSVITGIYKRLEAAGMDFIEVGFLDDRRDFDINRSIMPNTEAINKIFSSVKKGNAMPVAMIDYGTCSLESIGPCDSTFIDGIRVIFKKEKIAQALPFCKAIKDKGYKLFIQAISITSYTDSEMLDYVQKINEIKPYAFSIVDTYGLLDNKSMARYFYLIDHNLDPEIVMGYHEHNNFQLGFSNTIKFLEKDTTRTLVADSTVYGMGKSAGNCATELLAMHLNDYYNANYNLSQLLEIVDNDLMPIYQRRYWGYKYDFYISAMQNCHPFYVQYLLQKSTLSISSINEILSRIPKDKKLLYDKVWIEQAYVDYQNITIDDTTAYEMLKYDMKNKEKTEIVILGPGISMKEEKEKIESKIAQLNAIVFSVNFYDDRYPIDYTFISNAKRYCKFVDIIGDTKILAKLILTSNVNVIDYVPDYVLNYESLLSHRKECIDNSLLLLFNVMYRIGVDHVWLAGFDGFVNNETDYFDRNYEFSSMKDLHINEWMSQALSELSKSIKIDFITRTKYVIE
ncbi:aldolase catalytic domain-containing protein [Bacteroides intestinalis]|uniref:aldolase catalytic domain-containing protein n=1 Tax=Bacteroides intestinalis TaxID=329854 RepID=UPI00216AEE52|nr:aldolase catalytic domain-containing protein [Bacteroides intestinalis]